MVRIIRGNFSSFAIDENSIYLSQTNILEKFNLKLLQKIKQDESVESSSAAAAATAAAHDFVRLAHPEYAGELELPDQPARLTLPEPAGKLELSEQPARLEAKQSEEVEQLAQLAQMEEGRRLKAIHRQEKLTQSMENPINKYSSQNERRLSIYKDRAPIPELTDAIIYRKFYTDMTYETNDVISVFKNYMINILTYVLNSLEVSYTDCDFKINVEIDDLSSKIIMSIFCKDKTQTDHDLGHLSLFFSNQQYPKGSIHYTNRRSTIRDRDHEQDLGVYHLMLNKFGIRPLIKCNNSDFTQEIPFDDIFGFLTNKINSYPDRHSHMVVDNVEKTVNIIKIFIERFFDSISNKMIEINRDSIFGGYSPNTWFHHCY